MNEELKERMEKEIYKIKKCILEALNEQGLVKDSDFVNKGSNPMILSAFAELLRAFAIDEHATPEEITWWHNFLDFLKDTRGVSANKSNFTQQ